MTRTDAFLNLQADGTEHLAQGVTRTDNPDGSRTYRVDLTTLFSVLSPQSSGLAVNLSFDLIGFGLDNPALSAVEGSHVTVSDVRTGGLPQLHDAAATLAEDTSLSFDPCAQLPSPFGRGAGGEGAFAASLVNAPTHGTLAINANGTFSYTPELNYFGADSFSYRLNPSTGSGQGLASNLATVSLTITPVNDAPVVADVVVATAEDTPLVIALGAYASDVDSTTLTTQIVSGPAHGVLVANVDSIYSYTPETNYFGTDSFTYQASDGLLNSNIATVTLNVTPVNDAPVVADVSLTTAEDTATVNLFSR